MNWPSSYPNHKAFTLLEILVALAVGSIVATVMVSLLQLTMRSQITTDTNENILSNVYVIFDVIDQEIKDAEAIIPIQETGFPLYKPNNMGFIVQQKEKEGYQLLAYYLEKNKLYRYSLRTNQEARNADYRFGDQGINTIAENIASIEGSSYDKSTGICYLNIQFLSEDKAYELELYKTPQP